MDFEINNSEISKKWWEGSGGFFNDVYLEGDNSYDGFLKSPQDLETRTKLEVEGIMKLCKLKPKGTVMDLPSGYGRHSISLARKGFNVTGVDINDKFLKTASSVAKGLGLSNVKFIKKDMRHIEFKNLFDAAINMFYSFGFFESEDDNFKAIKNFHKALKPKGNFLLHTHITLPKILKNDYKKHEIRTLKTGNKLELIRDYDPVTKRENGQWYILNKDGTKKISSIYSMRIYDTSEFEDMCKKAGFRKVEFYSNWNGTPYHDSSQLLIMVATK